MTQEIRQEAQTEVVPANELVQFCTSQIPETKAEEAAAPAEAKRNKRAQKDSAIAARETAKQEKEAATEALLAEKEAIKRRDREICEQRLAEREQKAAGESQALEANTAALATAPACGQFVVPAEYDDVKSRLTDIESTSLAQFTRQFLKNTDNAQKFVKPLLLEVNRRFINNRGRRNADGSLYLIDGASSFNKWLKLHNVKRRNAFYILAQACPN